MAAETEFRVREAVVSDAAGMARVHVESWRETYRGLMSDELLDDPNALERRTSSWASALARPRPASTRRAVAESGGEIIGIAMTGRPEEASDGFGSQLYLLYVLQSAHGSGAGQALLDAVLDRTRSCVLWVADPNPRAQAFYRRNGFVADGAAKTDFGIRAIRMVRSPSTG